MRIAFVQEELYSYMGFMYLGAIAKGMQHEVEVFVAAVTDSIVQDVAGFKSDIICFTTTTPHYMFTRDMARKFRVSLPESFILLGGWHPTFSPKILEEKSFDALCLGEGEIPFKIFLESYPDKKKMKKIPNFHVKIDGQICKNPISNLVDNLDTIAFPDRSVYYDKYCILRNQYTKSFIVGRGCPNPCTYCFNEGMKNIYKGKGKYVRFRSPENIAEEINLVRKEYPMKYVQFLDDTFNSNKKWLFSFLDYYKREVGLPFLCLCRIERLDEETVIKMKEAGLDRVGFAIEQGNEQYRKETLRRYMKNSEIVEGCRILSKHGVRFHVSNMVGLPGETLNMAFETLKINQQIKPSFTQIYLFQPYKGTQITQMAKERGYIDANYDEECLTGHSSWRTDNVKLTSIVNSKDIKQMINLRSFFPLLVKYPFMFPLVKPLLSLQPNKYYELIPTWYFLKVRFKYSANIHEKYDLMLQLAKIFFSKRLHMIFKKVKGLVLNGD